MLSVPAKGVSYITSLAFSIRERLGLEAPAKLDLDVALTTLIILAIILAIIGLILYFYLRGKPSTRGAQAQPRRAALGERQGQGPQSDDLCG